ncbi:hypothetical protein G6011_04384 [Alternaria panax]|uniref:Cell wall protein n=1 Tax=Alternaria panax TaxID=48097 RepID=A0AAD4NU51_9PLEO|nr:hypothetical protein G6011_04384 [Alternaria panax]
MLSIKKIGSCFISASFFLHLVVGAPIGLPADLNADQAVDFDALLDGSLGNLPALWLTYSGILAEAAHSLETEDRQLEVPGLDTIFNLPATKLSPRDDRTDKENGAVAGTFMSSMLVPVVTGSLDDGLTEGLCKSLINGATGMAGAYIGQEMGKVLYPPGNGTSGNGTSASGIEQGIVPGTFFGSVVTNTLGTGLTKSICEAFLPELMKSIEYGAADIAEQTARTLNQGFKEVLTTHLTENLEVDAARAVRFASQMEETLRIVDNTGSLAKAVEFLNQELVATTGDVAEAVVANLASKPAISSLAQLSLKTLASLPIQGTPGLAMFPFDRAAEPKKLMSRFMSHFENTQEFAKSLGGPVAESATTVTPAVEALAEGAQLVAEGVGSNMAGQAGKVIKGATNFAKNFLGGLPNPLAVLPNPFAGLFHRGGHHAAPGLDEGGNNGNNGNGGEHRAQATVTVNNNGAPAMLAVHTTTVTVTTGLPQPGLPTPNQNMGFPIEASCTSHETLAVYTTSTQYLNEVVTQTQTVLQAVPTYVATTITNIVQIPQYETTTATQTVTEVIQSIQTVQYPVYDTSVAVVTQTAWVQATAWVQDDTLPTATQEIQAQSTPQQVCTNEPANNVCRKILLFWNTCWW